MFTETLSDLPPGDISVVGLEDDDRGIATLKATYRGVLGEIPDDRFFLRGAAEWAQQFADRDNDPDHTTV